MSKPLSSPASRVSRVSARKERLTRFQLRLSALRAANLKAVKRAEARERRSTIKANVFEGNAFAANGTVAPWLLLPPQREYTLYVPEHATREALPLVVAIHGCRQSVDDFQHGTRLNELADREGFAVLYPEQTSFANMRRCWNWFDSNTAKGGGECAIVRAMIDTAFQKTKCDTKRVYALGLSSGAAIAGLLAFHFPQQFAAVAMHSGLPPLESPTISSAVIAMKRGVKVDHVALARAYWLNHAVDPPPLMVLHGDEDARVHERNATALVKVWETLFEGAPNANALRRETNAFPADDERNARGYTQTKLLKGDKTVVRGLRIHGLAHAWSGGDAEYPFNDAKGPDATAKIWRFFERNQRES